MLNHLSHRSRAHFGPSICAGNDVSHVQVGWQQIAFTSRLVHQRDNRPPEVVAVNALETTARSSDEGSLGARAF